MKKRLEKQYDDLQQIYVKLEKQKKKRLEELLKEHPNMPLSEEDKQWLNDPPRGKEEI